AMHAEPMSRRAFVERSTGALALLFMAPRTILVNRAERTHPDPRPGITSERVLTGDALSGLRNQKDVLAAYDAARSNPEIFDGLACACGCDGMAEGDHRSLLVCYETRQPTGCPSCRMEAELV